MQKITPFLWFDHEAEEAMNYYLSVFKNSKQLGVSRYGKAGPGPEGSVMSASFELLGRQFYTLNGGPQYTFSPATSFFVNCVSSSEVDNLWKQLIDGGTAMMPLGTYPFSERYGWLQDRFGVSWQLNLAPGRKQKITPALLFVGNQFGKVEQAIASYTSIFAAKPGRLENSVDSLVFDVSRREPGEPEPAGSIKYALFSLAGDEFVAMESNADHRFTFSPATSFFVNCETQAEVDYFWDTLSKGGKTSQCGWLDDQYGVTWQIVPAALNKLLGGTDREGSTRAMTAMLQMTKLDIQKLQDAYDGTNLTVKNR